MAAFRGVHVSPAKHSYAWLPRKCDYRTKHRDRQTDTGQSDPYVPLSFAGDTIINIVAAFQGMHVLPVKHSYGWLPRKCDYCTDTQTDGWTDKCRTKWSLCAAMLHRWNKMWTWNTEWSMYLVVANGHK